ncbi:MAG: Nif3-like dinuclear metal center hexameric protein [Cellulosilyticaceae bacterium]
MHTVGELIGVLEQIAPPHLAEGWDNVGLMIGSRKATIAKVLCALDLTADVLDEAMSQGVGCIVTHHPFLFSPLKKLELDTTQGEMIAKLIKHDIAVYSMHTNLDTVAGGINDVICNKLGIDGVETLHVSQRELLWKLCVYVPQTHAEAVREVLIASNHYCIGNYTGCTFTSSGEGTFMPLEGATPFMGEMNQLEKVPEVKLETIVRKGDLAQVLKAVQSVHPYEEIAYDVFELQNIAHTEGFGRYGMCAPMTLETLVQKVKAVFGIGTVRVVGRCENPVTRIALCSGSGSSFLADAARVAQVYITGDMKFHEAQEALARGLCVIDIGHYASENVMMPVLAQRIGVQMPKLTVMTSTVDAEVFRTI